ncbi:MAG TPA: laccase domain-containing protein [Candidatus Saccharimonadales bacterium]|nr:laccase domain-containing protein [Candidatus Saccharimonadales bacterium]
MITTDQPKIFGDAVIAAVSSRSDGNLKFGLGDDSETLKNRTAFLSKIGIDISQTSLVGITYDTDDFTKYRIADVRDKSIGMLEADMSEYVDALVVRDTRHALFLPLADCAGVILYDPNNRALMVSHLGRHSVEQEGAKKSVAYLEAHCNSDPGELLVWISPSVGNATYPLHTFGGKSLQEVIVAQFKEAGVKDDRIETSHIDTAHDPNYFSHSEYLKGNEPEAGRFAVVAEMTAQGEPAI